MQPSAYTLCFSFKNTFEHLAEPGKRIPGGKVFKTMATALFVIGFLSLAFSSFGQAVGDYRSAQSGDWSELSTWERWDGDSWETPSDITFETNSSAETENVSSHDIALPPNIAAGDLLLVFWMDRTNETTLSGFGGYTELYNDVANTSDHRYAAYYKIADGTEGSTLTITTTDVFAADDDKERSAHNTYRIAAGILEHR